MSESDRYLIAKSSDVYKRLFTVEYEVYSDGDILVKNNLLNSQFKTLFSTSDLGYRKRCMDSVINVFTNGTNPEHIKTQIDLKYVDKNDVFCESKPIKGETYDFSYSESFPWIKHVPDKHGAILFLGFKEYDTIVNSDLPSEEICIKGCALANGKVSAPKLVWRMGSLICPDCKAYYGGF